MEPVRVALVLLALVGPVRPPGGPASPPGPLVPAADPKPEFMRMLAAVPGPDGGEELCSDEVGAALAGALGWLLRHQSTDGEFSADAFPHCCLGATCPNTGRAERSVEATALAIQAFLGASLRHDEPVRPALQRAAHWLLAQQSADGAIGPPLRRPADVARHAMATSALLALRHRWQSRVGNVAVLQRAVDALFAVQDAGGGWGGSGSRGDADPWATAWAAEAAQQAEFSGLVVPEERMAATAQWIRALLEPRPPEVGSPLGGDGGDGGAGSAAPRSPASLAAALYSRGVLLRRSPDSISLIEASQACLAAEPPRRGVGCTGESAYWYFGAWATFSYWDEPWKRWQRPLRDTLIPSQRRGGDVHGSWDPSDAWTRDGGRMLATAINTLALEAYARTFSLSYRPMPRAAKR